jgi:hypothetical protein
MQQLGNDSMVDSIGAGAPTGSAGPSVSTQNACQVAAIPSSF